jgi:hypothetical protein
MKTKRNAGVYTREHVFGFVSRVVARLTDVTENDTKAWFRNYLPEVPLKNNDAEKITILNHNFDRINVSKKHTNLRFFHRCL